MQQQEVERQFEKHIKENELLIYKVCRIYAYTDADREDLFQEIVLQLWTAYGRFRGESKFSTWLYRVAINTAITGLRKKKDFIEFREPAELPAPVYEENAGNEEKFKQLHTAIARLNEVEKAIVMLYMEEKSYDEMEEIIGLSAGNLKVKMSRIKEKLRQLTKNN